MTLINRKPFYVEFSVVRGHSTTLPLEFVQDGTNAPVNYTGYTNLEYSLYWPAADTTVQLQTTNTDLAQGLIVGRIGNAQWSASPSNENEARLLAKILQPDGEQLFLAYGRLLVTDYDK